MSNVDVLILTALHDELEAVLGLGDDGRVGWRELRDSQGFLYYQRVFPSVRSGDLVVAAAWSGAMGERVAASRAQQLLGELHPSCLAMCGICAGHRGKVNLGDVIVAEQLYSYDEGKVVLEPGKEPEMRHSLRTFDIEATWKMDAAFLARALDVSELSKARPPSKGAQQRWLLEALYAHEFESGVGPAAHPDRKRACPNWPERLKEVLEQRLVVAPSGKLALTDQGRETVRYSRVLHPDGLPEDPPFRILLGAIATGKAVQEDPNLFKRLQFLVRTTCGVEMEGAAVGEIAERFKKRAIIVKAVSDHADHEKDDSFRAFACNASAQVLMAFLLKYFDREASAPKHAGHATQVEVRDLKEHAATSHSIGIFDLTKTEEATAFYAGVVQFINKAKTCMYVSGRGFSSNDKEALGRAADLIAAEGRALARGCVINRIQVGTTASLQWRNEYANLLAKYPDKLKVYLDPAASVLVNVRLVDPGMSDSMFHLLVESHESWGGRAMARPLLAIVVGRCPDLTRQLHAYFETWIDRKRQSASAENLRALMGAKPEDVYFAYGSNLCADQVEGGAAQSIFDRGIREGELRGIRNALFRLIARFGFTLTDGDRARIQSCDDAMTLDRWTENVLKAKAAADVFS